MRNFKTNFSNEPIEDYDEKIIPRSHNSKSYYTLFEKESESFPNHPRYLNEHKKRNQQLDTSQTDESYMMTKVEKSKNQSQRWNWLELAFVSMIAAIASKSFSLFWKYILSPTLDKYIWRRGEGSISSKKNEQVRESEDKSNEEREKTHGDFRMVRSEILQLSTQMDHIMKQYEEIGKKLVNQDTMESIKDIRNEIALQQQEQNFTRKLVQEYQLHLDKLQNLFNSFLNNSNITHSSGKYQRDDDLRVEIAQMKGMIDTLMRVIPASNISLYKQSQIETKNLHALHEQEDQKLHNVDVQAVRTADLPSFTTNTSSALNKTSDIADQKKDDIVSEQTKLLSISHSTNIKHLALGTDSIPLSNDEKQFKNEKNNKQNASIANEAADDKMSYKVKEDDQNIESYIIPGVGNSDPSNDEFDSIYRSNSWLETSDSPLGNPDLKPSPNSVPISSESEDVRIEKQNVVRKDNILTENNDTQHDHRLNPAIPKSPDNNDDTKDSRYITDTVQNIVDSIVQQYNGNQTIDDQNTDTETMNKSDNNQNKSLEISDEEKMKQNRRKIKESNKKAKAKPWEKKKQS